MSRDSQIESYLKNQNKKQFSNQTFYDFRKDLLDYANTYYKDNIVDFSEVSLGGMLLDFAAIVGDSLVYYAEQQFQELDYLTATDPENIIKHLKKANIKNSKASPSSVYVDFTIEVERDPNSSDFDLKPLNTYIPTIKKGTILNSDSGIIFTLQEDLDFSLSPEQEIGEEDIDGEVQTLLLTKQGLCISGEVFEEVFDLTDQQQEHFLSIELDKEDITNVISVVDSDDNVYHEVDYLTQSTVFKKTNRDNENYITIIPATYRFVREENYLDRKTTLRFGNGNSKEIDNNSFSNTKNLLLPLKNKDTMSRVDLDPAMLLSSNTLGASPSGKFVTVTYKYGGGTRHNVSPGEIDDIIGEPIVIFPLAQINNDYIEKTNEIISSLIVQNKESSVGGTQPLTLDELKMQIPSTLRSQSRIITHEDLISRILTMPSDFGRINKATVLNNLYTNSSKDLYIICKQNNGFYTEASDAIKINLSNYLNEFRLIGDSFNILDVAVYNFGINANITIKLGFESELVILDIKSRIIQNLRFDLFEIGTAIDANMINYIIQATDGVASVVTNIKDIVTSKSAVNDVNELEDIRFYNENTFSPHNLYYNGEILPPRGSIFEMRYNFDDIFIVVN